MKITTSLFVLPLLFVCNTTNSAPQISSSQLVKHIHLLREIKDKNASVLKPLLSDCMPGEWKMTQTDAHLSIHGPCIKVKWPTELKKYETLINTVIGNERQMINSHYVFYHAQVSYFRVLQDLIKYLHEFISMHPCYKDFNFIRAWSAGLTTIDASQFVKEYHKNGFGACWWGVDPAAKNMICVNLSLFGNYDLAWDRWECSFGYFLKNENICPPLLEKTLEDLFNELGVSKSYIAKLLQVSFEFETAEGSLFQIFVPKNSVDKYVYLSSAGSIPWCTPIVSEYFDYDIKAHTAISPILEKYVKNPLSISDLNLLQARLFLTQDFVLNPQSNIKIIRHDTLPKDKKILYEAKLKMIAEEIATELVSKVSTKAPSNEFLRKSPLALFFKYTKIN